MCWLALAHKQNAVNMFLPAYTYRLILLKIGSLVHLIPGIMSFGGIPALGAPSYKQLKITIISVYSHTSLPCEVRMNEIFFAWTKRKPMHHERVRVLATYFLHSFLIKIHYELKRRKLSCKIANVCQRLGHEFWAVSGGLVLARRVKTYDGFSKCGQVTCFILYYNWRPRGLSE